jgi:hypothetical protein
VTADVAADVLRGTGYDASAGRPADDLRLCDLLLAVLRAPGADGLADGTDLAPLLRRPRAERDTALAGRRAALLKPTQDLATVLGLEPGDWDALRLPQVKSDF